MLNIGLGEAHAAWLSLHNSSVAHDGSVILALYVEKAPSQWRVGNGQFDGSKKHGLIRVMVLGSITSYQVTRCLVYEYRTA